MVNVSRQEQLAPDAPAIIAVVGPTASGKSELAVALARKLGTEIVNADAFALYRGMDIGTAKPDPQVRGQIRHWCLDLLDVTEPASVAKYQAAARAAVRSITATGRPAVVAGGSVLYVHALCDELDIPPRDPAVRARLQQEAEHVGGAGLHRRLAAVDPAAAAAIDPRNVRRLVRALEVVELTGTFAARIPAPVSWRPTVWLALSRSRAELDERIAVRVRRMWAEGLLSETEELLGRGLAASPTARRAVGYRQALDVLAGNCDEQTAIADTIRATSKLARRQDRAFRADARVAWLAPDEALAESLARVGPQ